MKTEISIHSTPVAFLCLSPSSLLVPPRFRPSLFSIFKLFFPGFIENNADKTFLENKQINPSLILPSSFSVLVAPYSFPHNFWKEWSSCALGNSSCAPRLFRLCSLSCLTPSNSLQTTDGFQSSPVFPMQHPCLEFSATGERPHEPIFETVFLWFLDSFDCCLSSLALPLPYLYLETGRGSGFWFVFCFWFFGFFLPDLLWLPSTLPLFQICISDFPMRIGIFVLSSKNFNSRKDTLILRSTSVLLYPAPICSHGVSSSWLPYFC